MQRSIRLVALDMDGTVTQHKSKLEPFNKVALDKLQEKYKIIFVGAGSCTRIWNQLNHYPVDIVGNYGMQHAVIQSNGELDVFRTDTVQVNKESIAGKITEIREKYNLTIYSGESVEFHDSGLVTFPLLGTTADICDKLCYDPDRKKRRTIYKDVCSYFPEYTVFIGGSSSFDLAPPPYNKLWALQEYANTHGYDISEILYIGDDYGLGGNDEQIFKSEIKTIGIDDYHDFPKIVETLL